MLRVIREVKPRWVVGENVPGIIRVFLDQAVSDLENEGYTVETFVLPACAFDAPHRRDRVFIVANTSRERWGGGSRALQAEGSCPAGKSGVVADTDSARLQKRKGKDTKRTREDGWGIVGGNTERQSESGLGRMADGLPCWLDEPDIGRTTNVSQDRVARLKALGNAVVPQVAEHIGRIIIQADEMMFSEGAG